MRFFLLSALAALLLASFGPALAQTGDNSAEHHAERNRLEADVRLLADDLFKGREAGTRGHKLAAKVVAERFRALGLEPGGDDSGYYQQIALRAVRTAAPEGGSLTLEGPGAPAKFKRGEDYIVGASVETTDADIEAEVVFAGFGLTAPEYDRDDYAGLDVEGKIVAYFSGAPKFLNSEERAHYNSTRAQRASERGAVGAISIWTPELENRSPFERAAKRVGAGTSMRWLDGDDKPFSTSPNIIASASVSMDGAEKLFAAAPHSYDELLDAAQRDEGAVPAFPLNMTARIGTASTHKKITSPNVIAVLPGSDPALASEFLVLTAHLDHIGRRRTEEKGDDEINNGAVDNATGIASLLEAARLLALDPPRRSLIFIALTAEEKGLIGSDYFARNPTVPAEAVVGNINLDMPIITYPFKDIIAYGGERSTMFPIIDAAAARAGAALSPDPEPEQGSFTRSDQYSFVKQGVPAIKLSTGWANGGEAAHRKFRKTHYHQTADEADIVDYDALRLFAQINYEIIRDVANADERPLWRKGDFFARTFGGAMEE